MRVRTKLLTICLSILFVIVIIVSCCQIFFLHHKNWILGKNAEQIQDKYGAFDQVGNPQESDGLYKNCVCAYYITDLHYGDYLHMFCVSFDSNGIARECSVQKGPFGG